KIAILREILEAQQEKVDIGEIGKVKELSEVLEIFGYDGKLIEMLDTFKDNFVKATFDKKTGVLAVELKEMSVDDVKRLSSMMVKEERIKITNYLEAFEKSGISKFTDGKGFNVKIESTRSGIKIKEISFKLDLDKNIAEMKEALYKFAHELGLKEFDKKMAEDLLNAYKKANINNVEVKYDFQNQALKIGNELIGKEAINVVKNMSEKAQQIAKTVLDTLGKLGADVDKRKFFVGMVTNKKGSKTVITPIFGETKAERKIASDFVQKYATKIGIRGNIDILQFATGISIDLANGNGLVTITLEDIKDVGAIGPQGMKKILKILQEQGLIEKGIDLDRLTTQELEELINENKLLQHINEVELNLTLEEGKEINIRDLELKSIKIDIRQFSEFGAVYGGNQEKLQKVEDKLIGRLGVESFEIKFDPETGKIKDVPMFKKEEIPKLKGSLWQRLWHRLTERWSDLKQRVMVAAGFQPASKEDLSSPAEPTKVEKSDLLGRLWKGVSSLFTPTQYKEGTKLMGTDGFIYEVDGKGQPVLVDCKYNIRHKIWKQRFGARLQIECIKDKNSGRLELAFVNDQEAEVTIKGKQVTIRTKDGIAYIQGEPLKIKNMTFSDYGKDYKNLRKVKRTAYVKGFMANGSLFVELVGKEGDTFYKKLTAGSAGGSIPEGISSHNLAVQDLDVNSDGIADYQKIVLKKDSRLAAIVNPATGDSNYLPLAIGLTNIEIIKSVTGVEVPGVGKVIEGKINSITISGDKINVDGEFTRKLFEVPLPMGSILEQLRYLLEEKEAISIPNINAGVTESLKQMGVSHFNAQAKGEYASEKGKLEKSGVEREEQIVQIAREKGLLKEDIKINIAGKNVVFAVEKGILERFGGSEGFKEFLNNAITQRAEAREVSKEKLFGGITHGSIAIVVLDKSHSLFENHIQDGFIGINRSVLEKITDKGALATICAVGLTHELRHEAGIPNDAAWEEKLNTEDTLFTYYLAEQNRLDVATYLAAINGIATGIYVTAINTVASMTLEEGQELELRATKGTLKAKVVNGKLRIQGEGTLEYGGKEFRVEATDDGTAIKLKANTEFEIRDDSDTPVKGKLEKGFVFSIGAGGFEMFEGEFVLDSGERMYVKKRAPPEIKGKGSSISQTVRTSACVMEDEEGYRIGEGEGRESAVISMRQGQWQVLGEGVTLRKYSWIAGVVFDKNVTIEQDSKKVQIARGQEMQLVESKPLFSDGSLPEDNPEIMQALLLGGLILPERLLTGEGEFFATPIFNQEQEITDYFTGEAFYRADGTKLVDVRVTEKEITLPTGVAGRFVGQKFEYLRGLTDEQKNHIHIDLARLRIKLASLGINEFQLLSFPGEMPTLDTINNALKIHNITGPILITGKFTPHILSPSLSKEIKNRLNLKELTDLGTVAGFAIGENGHILTISDTGVERKYTGYFDDNSKKYTVWGYRNAKGDFYGTFNGKEIFVKNSATNEGEYRYAVDKNSTLVKGFEGEVNNTLNAFSQQTIEQVPTELEGKCFGIDFTVTENGLTIFDPKARFQAVFAEEGWQVATSTKEDGIRLLRANYLDLEHNFAVKTEYTEFEEKKTETQEYIRYEKGKWQAMNKGESCTFVTNRFNGFRLKQGTIEVKLTLHDDDTPAIIPLFETLSVENKKVEKVLTGEFITRVDITKEGISNVKYFSSYIGNFFNNSLQEKPVELNINEDGSFSYNWDTAPKGERVYCVTPEWRIITAVIGENGLERGSFDQPGYDVKTVISGSEKAELDRPLKFTFDSSGFLVNEHPVKMENDIDNDGKIKENDVYYTVKKDSTFILTEKGAHLWNGYKVDGQIIAPRQSLPEGGKEGDQEEGNYSENQTDAQIFDRDDKTVWVKAEGKQKIKVLNGGDLIYAKGVRLTVRGEKVFTYGKNEWQANSTLIGISQGRLIPQSGSKAIVRTGDLELRLAIDIEGKEHIQIFYEGEEYKGIYKQGNHIVGVKGKDCKAWDLETGKEIGLTKVKKDSFQKFLKQRKELAEKIGYKGDITDYEALEKFIEQKAQEEIAEFRKKNAALAEELGLDINKLRPEQFMEKINVIMQLIFSGRNPIPRDDKETINEKNIELVKKYLGKGFKVSIKENGILQLQNQNQNVEILDVKRGREIVKNKPEGKEQRYALIKVRGAEELRWINMVTGKKLIKSQDVQDSKGDHIRLYSNPNDSDGCSLITVKQEGSLINYSIRQVVTAQGEIEQKIVTVKAKDEQTGRSISRSVIRMDSTVMNNQPVSVIITESKAFGGAYTEYRDQKGIELSGMSEETIKRMLTGDFIKRQIPLRNYNLGVLLATGHNVYVLLPDGKLVDVKEKDARRKITESLDFPGDVSVDFTFKFRLKDDSGEGNPATDMIKFLADISREGKTYKYEILGMEKINDKPYAYAKVRHAYIYDWITLKEDKWVSLPYNKEKCIELGDGIQLKSNGHYVMSYGKGEEIGGGVVDPEQGAKIEWDIERGGSKLLAGMLIFALPEPKIYARDVRGGPGRIELTCEIRKELIPEGWKISRKVDGKWLRVEENEDMKAEVKNGSVALGGDKSKWNTIIAKGTKLGIGYDGTMILNRVECEGVMGVRDQNMLHVYKYINGTENPLMRVVFENAGDEAASLIDELAKIELKVSDVDIENGDGVLEFKDKLNKHGGLKFLEFWMEVRGYHKNHPLESPEIDGLYKASSSILIRVWESDGTQEGHIYTHKWEASDKSVLLSLSKEELEFVAEADFIAFKRNLIGSTISDSVVSIINIPKRNFSSEKVQELIKVAVRYFSNGEEKEKAILNYFLSNKKDLISIEAEALKLLGGSLSGENRNVFFQWYKGAGFAVHNRVKYLKTVMKSEDKNVTIQREHYEALLNDGFYSGPDWIITTIFHKKDKERGISAGDGLKYAFESGKLIDWRDTKGVQKNILTPDGWQSFAGVPLSWKESFGMQFSGFGNFWRTGFYNLKETASFAGRQSGRGFGLLLYLDAGVEYYILGLTDEAKNVKYLADNWVWGGPRRGKYAIYGSDSQLFCDNPYFGPTGIFNEAMELGGKVAFGKGASIGERIFGGIVGLGGVTGKVLTLLAGTKGLEVLGASQAFATSALRWALLSEVVANTISYKQTGHFTTMGDDLLIIGGAWGVAGLTRLFQGSQIIQNSRLLKFLATPKGLNRLFSPLIWGVFTTVAADVGHRLVNWDIRKGLTWSDRAHIFAITVGTVATLQTFGPEFDVWGSGAKSGLAKVFWSAWNNAFKLFVVWGNVFMTVDGALQEPEVEQISFWKGFWNRKRFWKRFSEDFWGKGKGLFAGAKGGAIIGAFIGLTGGLSSSGIASSTFWKNHWLGKALANLGNWYGPAKFRSYLTWPTTAVAGRSIFDREMTRKDMFDTALFAFVVRFLSFPNKAANWLTRRGRFKDMKILSNIARHFTLFSGGGGLNIVKDFGIGELEKITGIPLGDKPFVEIERNQDGSIKRVIRYVSPNGLSWGDTYFWRKLVGSGVRGWMWTEIASFGIKNFTIIIKNVKGYSSLAKDQLRPGLRLTGSGAMAYDSLRAAIRWIKVGPMFSTFGGMYNSVWHRIETGEWPNKTIFNLQSQYGFIPTFSQPGKKQLIRSAIESPKSGARIGLALHIFSLGSAAVDSWFAKAKAYVSNALGPAAGQVLGSARIAAIVTGVDAALKSSSSILTDVHKGWIFLGKTQDGREIEIPVTDEEIAIGVTAKKLEDGTVVTLIKPLSPYTAPIRKVLSTGLSQFGSTIASWMILFAMRPSRYRPSESVLKKGLSRTARKVYEAYRKLGLSVEESLTWTYETINSMVSGKEFPYKELITLLVKNNKGQKTQPKFKDVVKLMKKVAGENSPYAKSEELLRKSSKESQKLQAEHDTISRRLEDRKGKIRSWLYERSLGKIKSKLNEAKTNSSAEKLGEIIVSAAQAHLELNNDLLKGPEAAKILGSKDKKVTLETFGRIEFDREKVTKIAARRLVQDKGKTLGDLLILTRQGEKVKYHGKEIEITDSIYEEARNTFAQRYLSVLDAKEAKNILQSITKYAKKIRIAKETTGDLPTIGWLRKAYLKARDRMGKRFLRSLGRGKGEIRLGGEELELTEINTSWIRKILIEKAYSASGLNAAFGDFLSIRKIKGQFESSKEQTVSGKIKEIAEKEKGKFAGDLAEYLVGKIRMIGENLSVRSMGHLEGVRTRGRTTTLLLSNGEKVKVQGFVIKQGIYQVAWKKILETSTIKETSEVLATAVKEISGELSGREIVGKQRKKLWGLGKEASKKLSGINDAKKEKSIKNLLDAFKEAEKFLNKNRKTADGIIGKVLSKSSKIIHIEMLIRDIEYGRQKIREAESELEGTEGENRSGLGKIIRGYKEEIQAKEKDLNKLISGEREKLEKRVNNLKGAKEKLPSKTKRWKWITNRRINRLDKQIESSKQRLQQVRKDTQDLENNKRSIEKKISSEYEQKAKLESQLAELTFKFEKAKKENNKAEEKRIEDKINKTKDDNRKLNRERLKEERGLFERYIWSTSLQNWRESGKKKVNSIILNMQRDLVDVGEEFLKRTGEHFWILDNIKIISREKGIYRVDMMTDKIFKNRGKVEDVVRKINESIDNYENYRSRSSGGRKFSLYRHQVQILLDMLFSSRRAFELVTGYGKTEVLTPLLAECSRELFKERFTRELLIFTDSGKARVAFEQSQRFLEDRKRSFLQIGPESLKDSQLADKIKKADIIFIDQMTLQFAKLGEFTFGKERVLTNPEVYKLLTTKVHYVFDEFQTAILNHTPAVIGTVEQTSIPWKIQNSADIVYAAIVKLARENGVDSHNREKVKEWVEKQVLDDVRKFREDFSGKILQKIRESHKSITEDTRAQINAYALSALMKNMNDYGINEKTNIIYPYTMGIGVNESMHFSDPYMRSALEYLVKGKDAKLENVRLSPESQQATLGAVLRDLVNRGSDGIGFTATLRGIMEASSLGFKIDSNLELDSRHRYFGKYAYDRIGNVFLRNTKGAIRDSLSSAEGKDLLIISAGRNFEGKDLAELKIQCAEKNIKILMIQEPNSGFRFYRLGNDGKYTPIMRRLILDGKEIMDNKGQIVDTETYEHILTRRTLVEKSRGEYRQISQKIKTLFRELKINQKEKIAAYINPDGSIATNLQADKNVSESVLVDRETTMTEGCQALGRDRKIFKGAGYHEKDLFVIGGKTKGKMTEKELKATWEDKETKTKQRIILQTALGGIQGVGDNLLLDMLNHANNPAERDTIIEALKEWQNQKYPNADLSTKSQTPEQALENARQGVFEFFNGLQKGKAPRPESAKLFRKFNKSLSPTNRAILEEALRGGEGKINIGKGTLSPIQRIRFEMEGGLLGASSLKDAVDNIDTRLHKSSLPEKGGAGISQEKVRAASEVLVKELAKVNPKSTRELLKTDPGKVRVVAQELVEAGQNRASPYVLPLPVPAYSQLLLDAIDNLPRSKQKSFANHSRVLNNLNKLTNSDEWQTLTDDEKIPRIITESPTTDMSVSELFGLYNPTIDFDPIISHHLENETNRLSSTLTQGKELIEKSNLIPRTPERINQAIGELNDLVKQLEEAPTVPAFEKLANKINDKVENELNYTEKDESGKPVPFITPAQIGESLSNRDKVIEETKEKVDNLVNLITPSTVVNHSIEDLMGLSAEIRQLDSMGYNFERTESAQQRQIVEQIMSQIPKEERKKMEEQLPLPEVEEKQRVADELLGLTEGLLAIIKIVDSGELTDEQKEILKEVIADVQTTIDSLKPKVEATGNWLRRNVGILVDGFIVSYLEAFASLIPGRNLRTSAKQKLQQFTDRISGIVHTPLPQGAVTEYPTGLGVNIIDFENNPHQHDIGVPGLSRIAEIRAEVEGSITEAKNRNKELNNEVKALHNRVKEAKGKISRYIEEREKFKATIDKLGNEATIGGLEQGIEGLKKERDRLTGQLEVLEGVE
ncbi:MAG TPA: hypothetical protein VMW39_05230, partial [bacterium]|nr:hypothetical protein [bacterium]